MSTLKHQASAAPGSSAGPPSWPSPPHVGDVSLPALCAGPLGSFSFARDASGAAGGMEAQSALKEHKQINTTHIC